MRLSGRSFRTTAIVLATVLLSIASGSSIATVQAAPSPNVLGAAGPFFTYLPALTSQTVAPLCRFGVNGAVQQYQVQPLRASWYVDYHGTVAAHPPPGITYIPMIRLQQEGNSYRYSIYPQYAQTTESQLRQLIAAYPGSYWFIGNEPDRKQAQDDIEPQVYAQAYHDLYFLIKGQDDKAKIIAGSIVQPTPLRLQYLDMVLKSYYERYNEAMPVDVWAIHNFILNEASCAYYEQFYPNDPVGLSQVCWGADIPPGIDATDGMRINISDNADIGIFKQQIVQFRQWLADRGYRGAPVFLSEYGVLMPADYGYPPSRVNQYMNDTFDYMLNTTDPALGDPADNYHLIQRFSWYSVQDQAFNGYLFDRNSNTSNKRTEMGDNFVDYAAKVDNGTDFYPVRLTIDPPAPLTAGGNVTFTLTAQIANSGNLAASQAAVVRFYNGDPANGGVKIGQDQMVSIAGCGETQTASVQWHDIAPGSYHVYAKVDADPSVGDVRSDNDSMSQTVTFAAQRLLLPAIQQSIAIP